jgi:hypothetical protein
MASWLLLAGLFVGVAAESAPATESPPATENTAPQNAATLDVNYERTSYGFTEPAFFVPPPDCQSIGPRFIFLPPPSENADTASYGTTVVARRLFNPPQLPQPLPAVTDLPDERAKTISTPGRHGPIILLPEPSDRPQGAAPYPSETPRVSH